jgi:hypothetical protein
MTLLRDVVPAEDTVPAGPRAPRLPRFLLVGATCGVAWAAALRGWMIQLAGTDTAFNLAGHLRVVAAARAAGGRAVGLSRLPAPGLGVPAPVAHLVAGVVALAGILVMGSMTLDLSPAATARGAWVGVYAASLVAVFCVACSLAQRPAPEPRLIPLVGPARSWGWPGRPRCVASSRSWTAPRPRSAGRAPSSGCCCPGW